MHFLKNRLAFFTRHKKLSLILFLLLAGVLFFMRPKPPTPIPTQMVKTGTIKQTVSASGTVAANNSFNLVFQIAGLVSYVSVKKGDIVVPNQTIAALDHRTIEKNLQTALYNYNEARNTFDQTIDDNKSKDLTNAIKRILANNQNDLNKAVVSVELQDLAKQAAVLTTPIGGIVTRADIDHPGVIATLSTTYTVVDPNSIVFNMDIDEADIAKVREGQQATITLDAYPDQLIPLTVARIDFVSHTLSAGGNAYTVEVSMPQNTNYRYRVGMNGTGDIITSERNHILIVPGIAIFNENHVYIKTPKGYEDKKVTLGIQDDTNTEVLGIHEGDAVALQPSLVPKQTKNSFPFP